MMQNRRLILFLAAVGLSAAAFTLMGLPYTHFSWANKAWAQTVYSETSITVPPVIAAPNANPQTPITSRAGDIPFVGRTDTNGDGIITNDDAPTVYLSPRSSDTGAIALPLAEGITDVLAVGLEADGMTGAYAGETATGTILEIVDIATGSRTPVELPTLQSPLLHFGSLYVVNNNGTNNIPILYSIDPLTGEIEYERSLERPNTEVIFAEEGPYMLAYTPASRLMRVFNLEANSDPLSLLVTGNVAAQPHWSPAASRLFYVMEDAVSRVELLNIVDAASVQTATVALPDYPDNVDLIAEWSSTGSFITTFAVGADGTLANTPMAVVRAADGSVTTFDVPGLVYAAVGWSNDDGYLTVTETNLNSQLTKLMVFDTRTGVVAPVPLGANTPLRAAWHPTLPQLAVFIETGPDTYEIVIYDAPTDTLTPLHQMMLSPYDAASLTWLADGESLLFVALTEDPLSQMVNAQTTSLIINADDGSAAPFLPDGIALE